jgi:hypothetical protein
MKRIVIGAVLAVLVIAAFVVAVWMKRPAPEPASPPQARTEPVKAPPPPMAVAPEPEPAPESPRPSRPRPKKEKPAEPAPAAPAAPAGPILIIESDVPGASVFVDRKYVGTTPVRTTEVAAGQHQLNASADGEDGVAQAIDVNETGETTITVRFKDVRLDASVAVVHKHGVGSCEGRLVATPAGMRYESANKKDAFSLGFSQIEAFEIDYLKKELKLKQKGGRTWNFTDKSDNADKLFVFHRDVTKARDKIAAQGR